MIAYSALAQGLLSTRYLASVPDDSRLAKTWNPQRAEEVTATVRERVGQFNEVATQRGQTLPQMAIAWTLRRPEVTSALIGASDFDEVDENVKALEKLTFTAEELQRIDTILRS